jgi:hypothetical protein
MFSPEKTSEDQVVVMGYGADVSVFVLLGCVVCSLHEGVFID